MGVVVGSCKVVVAWEVGPWEAGLLVALGTVADIVATGTAAEVVAASIRAVANTAAEVVVAVDIEVVADTGAEAAGNSAARCTSAAG